MSQQPSPCDPTERCLCCSHSGEGHAEVGLPWAVASCPLQGLESTGKVLFLRLNSSCHVKACPSEIWGLLMLSLYPTADPAGFDAPTMLAGPCPVPQLCQWHFRMKYSHSWQCSVQFVLPGIEHVWGAPELGRGTLGICHRGKLLCLTLGVAHLWSSSGGSQDTGN